MIDYDNCPPLLTSEEVDNEPKRGLIRPWHISLMNRSNGDYGEWSKGISISVGYLGTHES